jgi:multisubunit Na+/H+ antiporter MnhE subunit
MSILFLPHTLSNYDTSMTIVKKRRRISPGIMHMSIAAPSVIQTSFFASLIPLEISRHAKI